ncbi:NAD-dependent epimerase/dehydratase family protein [Alkalicoccobacillus gibsonii]|uniref:NAD-dependent epimerase/dehydratase family protein n=1 Tax=Alkalicoccobacillus gibsonii TaxID=79881 RepID=UPI001933C40A|nr:NAD-dependent epimerase/dehydratase family protein [Alkalicoccobacillus gibsonii]MBM0064179.1 NAD-dependent epimerase/dehydratase family protein [Alkalicoccobacillus gibsonii]
MNKILVMGGTEFISKAVVISLIKRGYCVDFVTRGLKRVDFDGYHQHFITDRKDKEALKNLLKDELYDYIFDVSAYTKEDVENLIEAVDRTRLKRYIFISSGAVYLSSDTYLKESDDRGFNENWKNYGYDKKLAEDYLLELYDKIGFPCVIFRPSYVYGEGNNLKRESFLFDRAEHSYPIVIPVSGATFVQFIHIQDLVKVLLATMNNLQLDGKAFNLTHPEIIEWPTLIKTIRQIVKKEFDLKGISQEKMDQLNISLASFFPFRDLTYLLDSHKLAAYRLPLPSITLKEGLTKTYEWYLAHNLLSDIIRSEEYEKVVAASKTIDDK